MPRFYFHLRNDVYVHDEDGKELPDLTAAEAQARAYAIDMAAVNIKEHHKFAGSHCIELANEAGEIIRTVKFSDVVRVEL